MAWKWLSCPSAGPQKGSERMTTIEWTDETWNPTRGCTRISSGCEHCYAERVARRFDHPGGSYEGLTRSGRLVDGREVTLTAKEFEIRRTTSPRDELPRESC